MEIGGAGLVARVLGGYQLHGVGEALGEVVAVVLGLGAGLGALLVASPGAGAGRHGGGQVARVQAGVEVRTQRGGVGAGGGTGAGEQQLGREQGGLGVFAAAVGKKAV